MSKTPSKNPISNNNIKAEFISSKQNTLAIMMEIIKLRNATSNIQKTELEVFNEAFETMKFAGTKMPT